MISRWRRLSGDWKRWALWWSVLAGVVMLGTLVSSSFWICGFVLLFILPTD